MCVVGILWVLWWVLLIPSGPASSVHWLAAQAPATASGHAAEDEEDEEDGEDDETQEQPARPIGPNSITRDAAVILIVAAVSYQSVMLEAG
jgi:hypothetical protein